MTRIPTRSVWLVVCCLAAPLACGRPAVTPPSASAGGNVGSNISTGVSTGAVATAALADTATVHSPLTLPAQVYVEHDAVVAARAAGILDSLYVDIGARVAAGQLVGRIESEGQEIALAQATTARDNAERAVQRARAMLEAKGITAAEAEQAELQYRQAELEVRKARRELELTRIVAPFAGVVTARYARSHRLVADGDSLFRITEMAPLLVRVRVPEGSADALRPGDPVTVVGHDGATSRARVERVAPAYDPASGTREVVARVLDGRRLLPGANVHVRLGDRRRRVVIVPREMVVDGGYVLVMENDRTALRAVVLGDEVGDGRVEVVSGLAPGERVARARPPVTAAP